MKDIPAKRSKCRLAFALFLAAWLMKSMLGLIAYTEPKANDYPDALRGFPSPYLSDLQFYVLLPAVFAALNLLMLVFAKKLPKWLAVAFAVLQFLLLPVLVIFATGGV